MLIFDSVAGSVKFALRKACDYKSLVYMAYLFDISKFIRKALSLIQFSIPQNSKCFQSANSFSNARQYPEKTYFKQH